MVTGFKRLTLFAVALLGMSASNTALAYTLDGSFRMFYDRTNDAFSGGQDTSHPFEIYGGGYRIEGGNLHLRLITGFNPNTTTRGLDTYSAPGQTDLSVADLQLRTARGTFGLALSSHTGNITSIRDPFNSEFNLRWAEVNKGNLYANALFATGTYESYIATDAPCTSPNGLVNRCPTLIADYGQNLGNQQLSFSLLNGGGATQVNPDGTNRTGVWSINAIISLASLGLSGTDSFDLLWSVAECGNDFFQFRGEVPEPGTMALLGAGLLGLGAKRRRVRNS